MADLPGDVSPLDRDVVAGVTNDDDEDVVAFLVRQHREIREMFDAVASTVGAERADHLRCLVRALAVHETAEELIVHPVARIAAGGDERRGGGVADRDGGDSGRDGGDDGRDVVDARVAEERAARRLLADLERAGPDHPDFPRALAELRAAVLAHAAAEEELELPIVARSGDATRRAGLAQQLEAVERLAPTHPHPHAPTGVVGTMLVGPFASIADRVRDALARRPDPADRETL
jgi:hypothetical protein